MSRHLRKVIAAVLIPFAGAVLVGMIVLWPGGVPSHQRSGVGYDRQTQHAEVIRVDATECSANGPGSTTDGDPTGPDGSGAFDGPGVGGGSRASGESRAASPTAGAGGPGRGGVTSAVAAASGPGKGSRACKEATIRITTGKDRGRTFTEIVRPDASRQLHEGQRVVVSYAPDAPRDLQYSVTDVDRQFPLLLLAGIFALVVVAVGRLRGVMALVALAISFAVLSLFILPAILQGANPLVVAVIGASAIMLIALYLCHGLTARTSVAVLGTLISLVLTGVLGSVFVGWAALTGNTDDNTGLIHGLYPSIDMSGLLLAGVIIGSLGVLDDVTVTQTSAVWELHQADPSMGWRGLYRAGIRIGRDHIASVVNTLVLAYAGAALPLLLLFSIAQSDVGTVAGSEVVAEECVRTLVGSIGLVASVPVTTALAALVISADRRQENSATHPRVPRPIRSVAGSRSIPAAPARPTTADGGHPTRGRRRRRKH